MNAKEQMDYDALKRELADCKAELSRRPAKVEKVEPVVRYSLCMKCGIKIHEWTYLCSDCATAHEAERVKAEAAKPASAIYGACLDCGTTHEGGCVNTNDAEVKRFADNEARRVFGMPPLPQTAGVAITNPCGHGCNKVGIDCDNCADKPVKPNPQTAGEGAIAIEPWIEGHTACIQQLQRRVEAVENRIREGK